MEPFRMKELQSHIATAEEMCAAYFRKRQMPGGVKGLVKRKIQKAITSVMDPIEEEHVKFQCAVTESLKQLMYNAAEERGLSENDTLIEQQEKFFDYHEKLEAGLEKQILLLQDRVEELEQEVNRLKGNE